MANFKWYNLPQQLKNLLEEVKDFIPLEEYNKIKAYKWYDFMGQINYFYAVVAEELSICMAEDEPVKKFVWYDLPNALNQLKNIVDELIICNE